MDDVETSIDTFFVEREGEGVRKVLRSLDLFQSGLLDSLDLVTLAAWIERDTGRVLDVTSAEALQAMRTFDGMVAWVRRQPRTS